MGGSVRRRRPRWAGWRAEKAAARGGAGGLADKALPGESGRGETALVAHMTRSGAKQCEDAVEERVELEVDVGELCGRRGGASRPGHAMATNAPDAARLQHVRDCIAGEADAGDAVGGGWNGSARRIEKSMGGN